jgi:hypothetical protein
MLAGLWGGSSSWAMPKPPKDWPNRFATRTCWPRFSNAILPSRATTEARTLKTYQTSLGFYDLVVAAPSMKAARRDDVQAERGAQAPGEKIGFVDFTRLLFDFVRVRCASIRLFLVR